MKEGGAGRRQMGAAASHAGGGHPRRCGGRRAVRGAKESKLDGLGRGGLLVGHRAAPAAAAAGRPASPRVPPGRANVGRPGALLRASDSSQRGGLVAASELGGQQALPRRPLRRREAPTPRSCPLCRSRRRSSGCRTSRRRASTEAEGSGEGRDGFAGAAWECSCAAAAPRSSSTWNTRSSSSLAAAAQRSTARHPAPPLGWRTCSAYSPDRRRPPLLSNTRNQA